jgi:hypothetical protein
MVLFNQLTGESADAATVPPLIVPLMIVTLAPPLALMVPELLNWPLS